MDFGFYLIIASNDDLCDNAHLHK